MASRAVRAKKNMATGVVNKAVNIALPFICRTIIIQKLGAEYLGLGSLFTSILQVLSMAELGFSSAVVFSLYKPLAEHDTEEVCALLAFYRKVYRTVGSVILCVGLLLMPFLKYLVKGSYPSNINLYILYVIYLGNTVISYFAFAYKSVLLTASQRQDVIYNVDSAIGVIKGFVQIIMLALFKNYYLYIVWLLVFTMIYNVTIAILVRRRFPDYVCRGKLSADKVRKITKQIGGLAVGKVSSLSRNSFDSIVLSMFCGLVNVAVYSNYYYVFNAVCGLLGIVITSMTAGIGNSLVTETVEKNYQDFKKFNYLFGWIGSWCTVCLFCLYQPFMELWTDGKLVSTFPVMILFCIYFYITQMGQVRSMYTSAAGIWWELRYIETAEMVANLVLNFLLGRKFGMAGILWATIITVTVFSVIGITNKTFQCYFMRSPREYYVESMKYALFTVIGIAVTYGTCSLVTFRGFLGLAIKAFVCLVVPNIIFACIGLLNKNYREYIQSLIRMVL